MVCKMFLKLVILTLIAHSATDGAPAQGVDPNLKEFFIEADENEQMFSFRTNDQEREETTSFDPKTGKLVISGWYRYTGPDGVRYTVQYVANENGFQPLGAHLPGADPNPDLYAISTPLSGGISKTVLLSLVG
ncbi:larval cuticle protein 65Ag1-like [Anopheles maculipalpis]|uniref:larval cuticle protein 65Ag1-like n=1 Tax=Anopheles maculipalpis TaxID=1496333 RepID=UPI0021598AA7|nr:larval cuticle protein 65Ag1-like [Anopheles maculipalpis]